MNHITFQTSGTCSRQIDIDIDEEGRIQDVSFIGGCNGNLQGIGQLVRGMKVEDVKSKLEGIRCGYKNTSCPDQLARALKQYEDDRK
ncbi:MAG: TIGR03905 family TSCPD domain-containing protein [Prevotella sp.]|nr:TIGR03905 family TSCPD domain-containing protein [Prevotella sp.]